MKALLAVVKEALELLAMNMAESERPDVNAERLS
jgi:hypothetical protein